MKKIIGLFLVFIIIFSLTGTFSLYSAPTAANYAIITSPCDATVAEVIDGDSLLVRINTTGEYALVHMVGIDCSGYTKAYEYVNTKLLGKTVFVIPDGNIKSPVDRWNYAYIYSNSVNFNQTLVANGYAKTKASDSHAQYYNEFSKLEARAKSKVLGIWNVSENSPSYSYTGSILNINTATKSEIQEVLLITDSIASDIVDYRKTHPFKTIYDIKFVDGMTKTLFDDIRFKIGVSLNINQASKDELMMLIGVSNNEADKIIEYKTRNGITNLSTLYIESLIPRSTYNENKPFISLENVDKIAYAVPDEIVNINTASNSQLESLKFTDRQIRKIEEIRNIYSFKNMQDLVNTLGLSKSETNSLEDNITALTDINNAALSELKSLFGSHVDASKVADNIEKNRQFTSLYSLERTISTTMYNRIKDYIYIEDENFTNYLNINTATVEQMMAIGFNSTQANKLRDLHLNMKTAKDVPYDLKKLGFDKKVTLFTNINKASAAELKSLSTQMTDNIAKEIINYRDDQPFGSLDELKTFMSSIGQSYIYTVIKDAVSVY